MEMLRGACMEKATDIAAVRLKGVIKRFPESTGYKALFNPFLNREITVLDGLDLEIKPGCITGLLGTNGSGKSTLLRLICGLLEADRGTLRIFGLDPTDNRLRQSGDVAVVLPNERSFFWRLTVRRNLEFFALLNDQSPSQAASCAVEAAAEVGMAEELDRPFRELSDGKKQRVAIARGLLLPMRLLLVDEVTRSLDPGGADRVRKLLRRKVKEEGLTVLLVSHNLEEVTGLCERLALLEKGHIEIEGPTESVIDVIRDRLLAGEGGG